MLSWQRHVAVKNCLPRSGSMFAFGRQDRYAEMRVRIVSEGVLNIRKYLDDAYLQKGAVKTYKNGLSCQYAQYSDEFSKNASQILSRDVALSKVTYVHCQSNICSPSK